MDSIFVNYIVSICLIIIYLFNFKIINNLKCLLDNIISKYIFNLKK